MHNLSGADPLDETSGDVIVGVLFKRQRTIARKRGGERVEERGECWRMSLNEAVADCDGGVIESNFGQGVGAEGEGEEPAGTYDPPNLSRHSQPTSELGDRAGTRLGTDDDQGKQSARAMQDGVRLALLHFLQQLTDFRCGRRNDFDTAPFRLR